MPVSLNLFEGVILGKCGRDLSKAELDHEQVCFLHGLFPHNVNCQVFKLYTICSRLFQVVVAALSRLSCTVYFIVEYQITLCCLSITRFICIHRMAVHRFPRYNDIHFMNQRVGRLCM